MIRYEILKIWRNKKMLSFLLLLVLLNGILFTLQIRNEPLVKGNYKTYYKEAYQAKHPSDWLKEQEDSLRFQRMSGAVETLTSEPFVQDYVKRYGEAWVQKQRQLAKDRDEQNPEIDAMKEAAIQQIQNEIQSANSYGEWKSSLAQDAHKRSSITIFQKRASDSIIAKRVYQKYASLHVLLDKAVPSASITQVLNFTPMDLLILAWMVYLLLHLIMKEKESGYLTYTKSMTRGGWQQYLSKLFVSSIAVIVVYGLLLTECILLAMAVYGSLDFQAPVQAVSVLSMTPYPLTLGEFLFCYFVIGAFSFTLISMLLSMLAYRSNSLGLILMALCLIYGSSYLLYANFSAVSQFSYLHDFNLYMLMHPWKLLADYGFFAFQNVVVHKLMMVSILPFLMAVCMVIGYVWYRQPMRSSHRLLSIHSSFMRIKCPRLWWQELQKLMLKDKALYVCLILLGLGIFSITQQDSVTTGTDLLYNSYVNMIGDHVSETGNRRLEKQQQEFQALEVQLQKAKTMTEQSMISQKLNGQEAFEEYKAAYELRRETDVKRKLLKEDKYRLFYIDGNMSKGSYLLLMAGGIFMVVQSYHREKKTRMLTLQQCSPSRSAVHWWKIWHIFLITAFMTVLLYFAQLARILQLYPAVSLQTPVNAIQAFYTSDITLPLWLYSSMLLFIQLILLLGVLILLSEIMKRWNQRTLVMLGAFLCLLFPVLLPDRFQALHLDVCYQLFYPHAWLMHGYLPYLLLPIAILIIEMVYLRNAYTRSFPKDKATKNRSFAA